FLNVDDIQAIPRKGSTVYADRQFGDAGGDLQLGIRRAPQHARPPAETIVDFAHRNQVTQILVARPKKRSRLSSLLGNDLVLRIVRKAKDIRVIIVAERRRLA